MKNQWLAIVVFVLFSTDVFAETVKSNVEPKVCGESQTNVIGLVKDPDYLMQDGDRLPFSGAGNEYVFFIGRFTEKPNTVTIEETRRKSHIEDDLKQIATAILSGQPKDKAILQEQIPKTYCIAYTSAFKRSTIAIQIDSKPPINRSLIAGPEEHWSLSADMPVTNVKQLSYNPQTSSIVEKDKPASFYLGLNYKLGDVYTNYEYNKLENLSVKFLFKASSTPNESMGLGIGYSFDIFDVFVAKMWTRDNENTGLTTLGTTQSTVYGISFNVSKAISWMKEK